MAQLLESRFYVQKGRQRYFNYPRYWVMRQRGEDRASTPIKAFDTPELAESYADKLREGFIPKPTFHIRKTEHESEKKPRYWVEEQHKHGGTIVLASVFCEFEAKDIVKKYQDIEEQYVN